MLYICERECRSGICVARDAAISHGGSETYPWGEILRSWIGICYCLDIIGNTNGNVVCSDEGDRRIPGKSTG